MTRFLLNTSHWAPAGTMHSGYVPAGWLARQMPEMAEWLDFERIEGYVLLAEKTGDWDHEGSAEYRIFIAYADDVAAVAHRMRW